MSEGSTELHDRATDERSAEPASERPGERAEKNDSRFARMMHSSLGWAERHVERGGDELWRKLKKRPVVGVGAAAGVGLGLAVTVGASELAIAFAAGYAAYKVIKKREPPSKALEDAARLGL